MSQPPSPVRLAVALVAALALAPTVAHAGVAFGLSPGTLGGGFRWDAAPRIGPGGLERSLAGGLRFSLQGGGYQAYRDAFTWNAVPSVPDFSAAVNQAFNAWTAVDPVSGFGTSLTFVYDPTVTPVGVVGGGLNTAGAEIDLLAFTDGTSWNPGSTGTQGETFFNASGGTLTLTSGTVGYAAGPINGADVAMNSNPGAVYTLDLFRRILTHEIGHAIGLGDVEGSVNPGAFIDDNFNPATSATALATLTNSWAGLVNPLNPAGSAGLQRYTVPFADPGTTTPGVDLLMETAGVGIAASNPVTRLVPLTNDEYGIRQFLYPQIPEPTTLATLAGVTLLAARRRRA